MNWRRRFGSLFRSRRVEREIDDELSFHLDELKDSLIASGISKSEAEIEALKRFGDFKSKSEHTREVSSFQSIESLWRDLRFAARLYIRTPVFSGVVTVVLAVTIAVTTAVFSIYSHVALQSVDGVVGSNRLVSIGLWRDENEWINFSIDQYEFVSEVLTIPEVLVASSYGIPRSVGVGSTEIEAATVGVNANFFSDLGIPMLLGTDLASLGTNSAATNAVVSEEFWRTVMGAQANAVGSTILIDDQSFTVIGVAGGGFKSLRRGQADDIWVPVEASLVPPGPGGLGNELDSLTRRFTRSRPYLALTARLPAGVAVERLQQELELIMPRLRDASDGPQGLETEQISAEALPGTWSDPRHYARVERQTRLLLGGAVLVLLVAALNLASFMLARGPSRVGELRTRLAIGASAGAVVRQLFIESSLLVATAFSIGFVLHYFLRRALTQLTLFVGLPAAEADWRIAAFVVATGLAVMLVAGLLPAVRIARLPTLTASTRGAIGQGGRNLQPVLVLQIAVATLIVLSGAMFLTELWQLEHAPLGFEPENVVTAKMMTPSREGGTSLGSVTTLTSEQIQQLGRDVSEQFSALPGVEGFALATMVPIHIPPTNPIVLELPDSESQPSMDRRQAYQNPVSPEFFSVLRARFIHGRAFEPASSREVVVSRTLARRLWGREDVVGEDLSVAQPELMTVGQSFVVLRRGGDAEAPAQPLFTVVGVVEDMRYSAAEGDDEPILYSAVSNNGGGRSYVIRTSLSPTAIMGVVDGIVREHAPSMEADVPVRLNDALYNSLGDERVRSRLALGASVIALFLTIAGLYASMQYAVDARRGELAVRKAMGATGSRIRRMILGKATRIVVMGTTIAFITVLLFFEQLRNVMLGLNLFSPFAWIATLGAIALTSIGAALVPAIRAGHIDPAAALHYE